MGAWMLPSAAAAFAIGLLGLGATPGWLTPWMALAAGLVMLGVGWLTAGRERRGPGALARAGLAARDHEVVEAVGGRSVVSSSAPVLAAAISLFGVLTLGAGWGAFHDRALEGALLADLDPERVVLDGDVQDRPQGVDPRLVRRRAGAAGRVAGRGRDAPLLDLGQRERRDAEGTPRRPGPTGRDASGPRRRRLRRGAPP